MLSKAMIVGLVVVLASPLLRAFEVIDRIVARVNGNVVLQSDWEDEVAFDAFSHSAELGSITGEQRKTALDRLIDRELLREQMPAGEPAPSDDEIQARVAQLRAQYPQAQAFDEWQSLLASYGLTEAELDHRVSEELSVFRFVDSRLKPAVRVDDASVEKYYTQEFLPELQRKGAKPVPLGDVSEQIRELLLQKRVNESLTAWLQSLRANSEILVNQSDTSREQPR